MQITGWILDVYPVENGMCVWMVDADGQAHSFMDSWAPHFYAPGNISLPFLKDFQIKTIRGVEKKDFFTDQPLDVWEIQLANPLDYSRLTQQWANHPGLDLFNADLNLAQAYFYERDLFPLAFCSARVEEGLVQQWHLQDSPWELDYAQPPFRYAHLGLEAPEADPNHRSTRLRKEHFVLTLGKAPGEGKSYVMDGSEEELILSLNHHLADWDPDILLSDWGDSYVMPRLQLFSQRSGVPLKFSRIPSFPNVSIGNPVSSKTLDPRLRISGMTAQKSRSYMSYGKMMFKFGSRTLYGRLHIDIKNSFMFGHTGLDGLFEIARVAKIPLQRAARCTIGTSLSSMQHNWAVRNDYLIPLDKGQTEEFRSAEDLIASDRGGLVYEPEIGWHEDLIEFDFVSMYPQIMIQHNVTPEAINCACCPDNLVPEIPHHICRRRIGMIPHVLRPIVEKRAQYKTLIKAGHPKKKSFQDRRDAFKWALVTCFGYLGFRNARFGRIEAHECVNAFSREALLTAKAIAEKEGFHFVHAIVDSLWLKKPGASEEDVERLRQKIETVTGLPLGYEGRYRWIRFCPSRTNSLVGVPNRYFGVFKTGEFKVRGLELRRHDTPLFIKKLQQKLLAIMAQADGLKQLESVEKEWRAAVEETEDRLKNGQFSPIELAISVQLARRPESYVHDTLSAIAAKKLAANGLKLHLGEMIQYVVSEEKDKVKDWRVTPLALIEESFEVDVRYYKKLLDRAVESLSPFQPTQNLSGPVMTPEFGELFVL